jgi:transposase-like protein
MGRPAGETWAKRVQRWKDSGLTAREFAAETGLNPRTLSYWRWRLGRQQLKDEPAEKTEQRPTAVQKREAPSDISFVELKAPRAGSRERIEVVVGDRYTVRVADDFEAETLRRVLDVVEGRR